MATDIIILEYNQCLKTLQTDTDLWTDQRRLVIALLGTLKNSSFLRMNALYFSACMSASVLNFGYHVVMGRLLGPADYGILVSLMALTVVMSLLSQGLSNFFVKRVSETDVKKDPGYIGTLMVKAQKIVLFAGMIVILAFFLFRYPISSFFRLESTLPVVFISLFFFIILLVQIYQGVIQGLQDFKSLSLNVFSEPVGKLLFGTMFVVAGLKVIGALGGMLIGKTAAFFLAYTRLRGFLFERSKKAGLSALDLSYLVPTFIHTGLLSLLLYADVILVKHYFLPLEAGLYAALSTTCKAIYFATAPIAAVMFPVVSSRQAKGERHTRVFQNSLLLTAVLALPVLLFYLYAPRLVMFIFFGQKYVSYSPFIGPLSMAVFLMSLTSLVSNYFLAHGKTSYLYILGGGVVLLFGLIVLHHRSINEVIAAIFAATLVLSVALAGYYLFNTIKTTQSRPNP